MKTLRFFGYALMAVCLSMATTACSSSDSNDDTEDPANPDLPEVTGTMTPSEQKTFLEQTARELIGKVQASDFQTLKDIIEYARNNYVENKYYGTSIVEDWFETCLDACELSSMNQTVRRLYRASNFTGSFEAGSKGWEQTSKGGNTLQFTFKDGNGKTCVLKAVASDRYFEAGSPLFNETEDDDYNGNTNSYQPTRYENEVGVPEKVTVTFTQGDNTLVSAEVNTSLEVSSGTIDLENDNYNVTVNATISNYQIVVDKANFKGSQSLGVSTRISKNGETLLSMSAQANGKVRLEYDQNRYGDTEVDDITLVEYGAASVSMDVLGKVQVKGTVSNVKQLADILDAADTNRYDEVLFNNNLTEANNLIEARVFYNGGSTAESGVKLISSAKMGYNGTKYEPTPAIFFSDGTSYSFESFFDETTIKAVTKNFERLMEDFEDLVDDDE